MHTNQYIADWTNGDTKYRELFDRYTDSAAILHMAKLFAIHQPKAIRLYRWNDKNGWVHIATQC